MKMLPPPSRVLIRLGLSAVLLGLVVSNVDWQEVDFSRHDFEAPWMGLAMLCVLASNGLAAMRWGWMMHQAGLPQTWLRFIGLYFAGGLINQGLPSMIGGDAYRGFQASRDHRIAGDPATPYGFLVVLLDRVMGLLGNLALGALGLLMGGGLIATWLPTIGLVILVGLVVLLAALSWLLTWPAFLGVASTLLSKARLPHGLNTVRKVLGWPSNVVHWGLSVLIHMLTMGAFVSCLMAFGVSAPIEAVMIGLPALGLLLILPISMSGWGLREVTLSSVLFLWGVPVALTVMASVSFGLTVALCHLPAVWVLVRSRPALAASLD